MPERIPDRRIRYAQLARDLFIAHAQRNERCDFAFTFRERRIQPSPLPCSGQPSRVEELSSRVLPSKFSIHSNPSVNTVIGQATGAHLRRIAAGEPIRRMPVSVIHSGSSRCRTLDVEIGKCDSE